jgi:hypothetical protein
MTVYSSQETRSCLLIGSVAFPYFTSSLSLSLPLPPYFDLSFKGQTQTVHFPLSLLHLDQNIFFGHF